MKRRVLSTVLTAFLGLCGAGPAAREQPANVLLVTFDTTRADHMGYATGRAHRTPTLDALAGRGTWFSTCLVSAPLTLPSHTSILTGLYPFHHGVRNNGTYVIPKDVPTLPEILRSRGYATHAVVSAFVLDHRFGLDRGFEGYEDDVSRGSFLTYPKRDARDVADRAIRWLDSGRPNGRPFLLWLHFFDPHADYTPPAEVAALFPKDPYSAEIFYADRELGRVLSAVDRLGERPRTLVAFTADHGESLGEHGEATHGIFIYDSTMRVPLIFQGPGVGTGKRSDDLARSVDVAPTILSLLGMPALSNSDGRDLIASSGSAPQTAYEESLDPRLNLGWAELRGIRGARYQVIDAPRPEAYDLQEDSGELHNLMTNPHQPSPDPVRSLAADLRRLSETDPFRSGKQRPGSASLETQKKLASLGYLSGAFSEDRSPRPDPKDRIALWSRAEAAQALARKGRVSEAIPILEDYVRGDAENALALNALAFALQSSGRSDRALDLYRAAMRTSPWSEAARFGAARILSDRREFAEADRLLDEELTRFPENADAHSEIARLRIAQKRPADAAREFQRALDLDPASEDAILGLAASLRADGRQGEAVRALADARRLRPDSIPLTIELAHELEKTGDAETSAKLFEEATRLGPSNAAAWDQRGTFLGRRGDDAQAERCLLMARRLAPKNAMVAYHLGAVLLREHRAVEALPLLEEAVRHRADIPGASKLVEQARREAGPR